MNYKNAIICLVMAMQLLGCNAANLYKPGGYMGEPGVSFDLTNDQHIRNFRIVIYYGASSSCSIWIQTDAILAKDGSFEIQGEPDIKGKFTSPTTVEGEFSNGFWCQSQYISSSSGTWHAEAIPNDVSQDLLIQEFIKPEDMQTLGFSPDGRFLVTQLMNTNLEILDANTGESIKVLSSENYIGPFAFSPDGQLMATGSIGVSSEIPKVQIWNVSDWELLASLKNDLAVHESDVGDEVKSLVFSPDGTMLASGDINGYIDIWQVSDGALLQTLKAHESIVLDLAFSPDGNILASGSFRDIQLWQVSDWTNLRTLEPIESSFMFYDITFLNDRTSIAAREGGGNVYLWNVSDGSLLRNFNIKVADIAFSPDRTLMASASPDDHLVQIWRVSDGTLLASMFQLGVQRVAFSFDGKMIASLSWFIGDIRLWKVGEFTTK
jgi:WD40 repeat protein